MRKENKISQTHKIFSISAPSDTRFQYHQCERTEFSLRNHPVVCHYYEENDPEASVLDIYDSCVGIALQLGYVDIMRVVTSIHSVRVTFSQRDGIAETAPEPFRGSENS